MKKLKIRHDASLLQNFYRLHTQQYAAHQKLSCA